MKSIHFLIFLVITAIVASVVHTEIRYGSQEHPFIFWIVAGLWLGFFGSWSMNLKKSSLRDANLNYKLHLVLAFLVGVSFFGFALIKWSLDLSSTAQSLFTWPTVPAKIIARGVYESAPTKIRQGHGRFAATWNYEYNFDGKTFQSSSISTPGAYTLNYKYSSQEAQLDFPERAVGSMVTTYVNPMSPEQSTLDRRPANASFENLIMALGFLVALIGFIAALYVLKLSRKQAIEPNSALRNL